MMKRRTFFLMLFICDVFAHAQTEKVIYVPGSTVKICQLVGEYDRERQTTTINQTESRYGLISTDLGVPFRHNGRTYLLFGDTFGPLGGDAIAYTTDTNPEDGIELTFIHYQNGTYRPVRIPGISQGAFEVPMEGVSVGGRMYIYHTTDHSQSVTMGRSVVAVSDDDGRTFEYLYDFSVQHFINVSVVEIDLAQWQGFPLQTGKGLVIFGSGVYRQSDIRLAFQPADSIESPTSLRYFAGLDATGTPIWSSREQDAIPLFSHPYVGELSVTYNEFLHKWLLLYNSGNPRGINFRTAENPWGPWSDSKVLFDPWQDNGYCHFMHVSWQFQQCDNVNDPGREYEWGGEYGPYQFEDLATGNDSTTTIYFTMSTWNPYTVVLMKSTLKLVRQSSSVTNANPNHSENFVLAQNFPNPFNSETLINYQIASIGQKTHVSIKIFDMLGREIKILVDEEKEPGWHSCKWDGTDKYGNVVGAGVFFVQMNAEKFSGIKKILFLK